MKIVGIYSFNGGSEYVKANFPTELKELQNTIESIDANLYQTKASKKRALQGKRTYSKVTLNKAFKSILFPQGWANVKEVSDYKPNYYVNDYQRVAPKKVYPFRDMDFVKNKLGVEVQFGKYSFMVYNVCAKMTIFKKLGHIDAGIEIVPVKELADQMSTGVSYFEQFVWDLEQRGVSDIDIPVMILGILD